MSKVREATEEDLDALSKLCEESFQFGGLDEFYPFDEDIARLQCKVLIENPQVLFLVMDTEDGVKGMFSAHIYMGLFGKALVTHEGFMFVSEEFRGGSTVKKFMKKYNEWGEEHGAKMQTMVSHTDHDRFERFYSLFGYGKSEITYVRKV